MNGDGNLAVFCDFENIALGVRDAKLTTFEIGPVVARLLLKGSIVAKKAYCDWERYKQFKKTMHEAAFELIEIPHARQSGKNSADIRMVVDALDLCYTKEHIDTFVIVSGDSDFIFYDDLVAERQPARRRQRSRGRGKAKGEQKAPMAEEPATEDRAQEAIDLIVQTAEGLYAERGDRAKLWGSMIKQTLKRRRPGFSEAAYGFGSFNELLEEAQSRGLIELDLDERSGGYVIGSISR